MTDTFFIQMILLSYHPDINQEYEPSQAQVKGGNKKSEIQNIP